MHIRWRHGLEMLSASIDLCDMGNHWSLVDSPHKGMVELQCFLCCKPERDVWRNSCVYLDLRHHDAHVTSQRSWRSCHHDDVIKWKHFPRYWPFVRGIHRSPVNSPLKGQWRGALMFSLICVWINGWVNNREAGDLRRYRAHYDVTVMSWHHQVCAMIYLIGLSGNL